MRSMKLLGERLTARTPDRQTAELQIRAALLNRFSQLGTPETRLRARYRGQKMTAAASAMADRNRSPQRV